MITLVKLPALGELESGSPFCLKLEAFLNASNIPYQTSIGNNPATAPKGKFPYIITDHRKIGDSGLIIGFLKQKVSIDLDDHLTGSEKAISLSVIRMIEEHLYWVNVYSRWIESENYRKVQTMFFGSVPPGIRSVVAVMVRRKIRNQLLGHGLLRHSREEIYDMGKCDIDSLAALLADRSFFLSDRLSTVDIVAMAFLRNIAEAPFESPLKSHLKGQTNLIEFCYRIRQICFIREERSDA